MAAVVGLILLLVIVGFAFWSRHDVESDEWDREDYTVED